MSNSKFEILLETQDYYEILGVDKTASLDEIKAAYKKLARKYHPDKLPVGGDSAKNEEIFKKISEAKEVLTDPDKREQYDANPEGFSFKSSSKSSSFEENREMMRVSVEKIESFMEDLKQKLEKEKALSFEDWLKLQGTPFQNWLNSAKGTFGISSSLNEGGEKLQEALNRLEEMDDILASEIPENTRFKKSDQECTDKVSQVSEWTKFRNSEEGKYIDQVKEKIKNVIKEINEEKAISPQRMGELKNFINSWIAELQTLLSKKPEIPNEGITKDRERDYSEQLQDYLHELKLYQEYKCNSDKSPTSIEICKWCPDELKKVKELEKDIKNEVKSIEDSLKEMRFAQDVRSEILERFQHVFAPKLEELDSRSKYPAFFAGSFLKNGLTRFDLTEQKKEAINDFADRILSPTMTLNDIMLAITCTEFDETITMNRRTGSQDDHSESRELLREFRWGAFFIIKRNISLFQSIPSCEEAAKEIGERVEQEIEALRPGRENYHTYNSIN